MDLSKPLPNEVTLWLGSLVYEQNINYENSPLRAIFVKSMIISSSASYKVEELDLEKEVKKSPKRNPFPQGNPECHKQTRSEDEQQNTQAGPSGTKHINAGTEMPRDQEIYQSKWI